MPTGPGGLDANGVWQYGEDDTEALASDLLNLGMSSVSDVVAGLVTGQILQVVSTTKTDAFTTTSTSYADVTGLSATITPASTSSKILVAVSLSVNARLAAVTLYEIRRGSTSIGSGVAVGSRSPAFGAFYSGTGSGTAKLAGDYLDSPDSSSALTYSVRVRVQSGTLGINTSADDADIAVVGRTSSTITLMEVAG